MNSVTLRTPKPEDGPALHELIKRCPPLDENSRYCNLLQVSHFNETGIVAEFDDRLIGFVTGYRLPDQPDVLFVWQVGVSPEGRGQGLAGRMLTALLQRHSDVDYLETTVTPDNDASRSMFEGFAQRQGARLETSVMFDSEEHFDNVHDSEVLFRIGPFREAA